MLKITDKYFIDADSKCYTLIEKAVVQDKESKNFGSEIFKDLGYYVSLESCLKGYIKIVTRKYIKDNNVSIQELIKEVQKQTAFIESLNLKL